MSSKDKIPSSNESNIRQSNCKNLSDSSCNKTSSKLNLDEDGFWPRIKNIKNNDVDEIIEQNKVDCTVVHDSKRISSYSSLSKDVQFLLKVKKYRKEKENEDSGRHNGF